MAIHLSGSLALTGSITVGTSNKNIGTLSTIAGGTLNTSSTQCSFIGGGERNSLSGYYYNSIVGGCRNCIECSPNSTIAGGSNNTISVGYQGDHFIGAGASNCILPMGYYHSILGGSQNTINTLDQDCYFGVILGGQQNLIGGGEFSSIVNGCLNTGSGAYGFIGGGARNEISSSAVSSSILGGFDNLTNRSNTHIIGSNLTADKVNYTYVNNLDVEGTVSASIFSGSFVGDGSSLTNISAGEVGAAGSNTQIQYNNNGNLDASSNLTYNVGTLTVINRATIGLDNLNTGTSKLTTIAGGTLNTSSGACGFIGGGVRNYINLSAVSSSIIGGFDNTTNLANTHIIGSGLISDKADYTYVNNLDVEGTVSGSIFSGSFVGDGSGLTGISGGGGGGDYSPFITGSVSTGILPTATSANNSNTIGEFTTITGGRFNTGSSPCSFIGGGYGNSMTEGHTNAIVGGCNNCVSGSTHSSILAGFNNCVGLSEHFTLPCVTDPQPAAYSAIGAGKDNCMLYYYSFIGAGSDNVIDNIYGFIGAGRNNCIKFDTQGFSNPSDSFIGSGRNNCVFGPESVVVGGEKNKSYGGNNGIVAGLCNTTFGLYSFIGAGLENKISGSYSYSGIVAGGYNLINSDSTTIAGGMYNTGSSACSFIGGGCSNYIASTAGYSAIVGGEGHVINDDRSTIAGGTCNCIGETGGIGSENFIGGGSYNTISGSGMVIGGGGDNLIDATLYSTIAGGYSSSLSGDYSVIGGGIANSISTGYSGILGGCDNSVTHEKSFIIGSDLSSTATCYTFVNNLCNVGGGTSDCRLKENIQPITYGICQLKQLDPVSYNFIADESRKTKYGFLAQCVQEILPDLVYHHPTDTVDGDPVLQFDKEAIWSSMINALKEQQEKIDNLEARISALEG